MKKEQVKKGGYLVTISNSIDDKLQKIILHKKSKTSEIRFKSNDAGIIVGDHIEDLSKINLGGRIEEILSEVSEISLIIYKSKLEKLQKEVNEMLENL